MKDPLHGAGSEQVSCDDGAELDPQESWNSLLDLAHDAEKRGQRPLARRLFERALARLGNAPDPSRASAIFRWIARTWQIDANFEAALDCLSAAEAIAEAWGDEGAVGHALNVRAIVHWQRGELDSAQELYRLALDIAQNVSDPHLAAMTAQNLGVIANVRGDFTQALHYYRASLHAHRSLGVVRERYVVLNNLGRLYTERGEWAEAESTFADALEVAATLGETSACTMIEVNTAEMWVRRGEYAKARAACDRATARAFEVGDGHADGEANKIYGIIARDLGDGAAAERHFAIAARIADEREDLLLRAHIARERAELYRQQGRNRELLRALNDAHKIFTSFRARHSVQDVDHLTRKLEADFLEVVQRWGESIEASDQYTQGHCERVADLACALATHVGVEERAMFGFRVGALLHDLGKVVILPTILNKPDKLSADEWKSMKHHTLAGVEMLEDIDFPWDVLPIVRSHHENWDGSGYPDGLAGDAIPTWARIVCIADVYDALTSERSYKRALAHEDALEVMRRDVGRQFDPTLFTLFEELTRASPPPAREVARRVLAESQSGPREPPSAHDELTGLLMRRAFLAATQTVLADASASGEPVSLLVIDVDHFKLVNDTFGHLQGDDMLRSVADRLREAVRSQDIVGRYAGDEFVMLLPSTPHDVALEVANRVRRSVESSRLVIRDRNEGTISVTLSIGVASTPESGTDVESLFGAADRGLYVAKGRGRNCAASADDGTSGMRAPTLIVDRFVGRASELRKLIVGLENACDGTPQAIAVTGEAGVGKSTLLRQLRPEVRLRGGTMVVGRCIEADVKPPYRPWAEVIEGILALGLVPNKDWSELGHLAPTLGTGGASGGASGNKYAILTEIGEFLRVASASVPLTIVLDDMQWGDASTWDTLEFLLHQFDKERILICLTIRSEDSLPILERRRRLSRDERFSEIELPRLAFDDLRTWIETVFHQGDIGEEFPRFLFEYTEGNPLLVVHVLRTLYEDGAIWYAGKRWEWKPNPALRLPTAVADLTARRLARLSDASLQHLVVAAVVGRTFDVDIVIAASGAAEDELLDAIDEAISANVAESSGDPGSDRFSFTHALIADAVRRSVNPRRLRRIHERVAEALELHRPNSVAEIAEHFDAAGNNTKAFEYAFLAAERAAKVYAHDEAATSFAVAQRHAPTAPDLHHARFRHAQSLELAGRYEEAEALCDLMVAERVATGDRNPMLGVRRLREWLRGLRGQPLANTLEACQALLREAVEGEDRAEQVLLLGMLSHTQRHLGNPAAARELARESAYVAEQHHDARLLADTLLRLGSTLIQTEPDEARSFYERALDIFRSLEDLYGEARCHINLGIVQSRLGHSDSARAAYATALDLGRRTHAPDVAGLAALNLGVLHMQAGCYEDAEACLSEAMRRFRSVQNEKHRLAALYNLANLERERGDHEMARKSYGEAAVVAGTIGQRDVEIGARAGQGVACLALSHVEDARACLRTAELRLQERTDWWFQGRELVAALGIHLHIIDGDVERAVERFDQALTLAERNDLYGAAWLVAEVAAPLSDAGVGGVSAHVERFANRIRKLHYAPLNARYEALAQSA